LNYCWWKNQQVALLVVQQHPINCLLPAFLFSVFRVLAIISLHWMNWLSNCLCKLPWAMCYVQQLPLYLTPNQLSWI
jgi:hypothetical protein